MIYALDALLAGFAALYAWVFLSQLHTPGFGWLQSWAKRGWRAPLVSCPWCFGWWASIVIILALHLSQHRFDWVGTPLAWVAAAALCGMLGSQNTPGPDLDEFELE